MKMIDGYIDGNTVLVDQDLQGYDGKKVMITIMDEISEKTDCNQEPVVTEKQEALDQLFGLWANHDNKSSVEDTVRKMREGRKFGY